MYSCKVQVSELLSTASQWFEAAFKHHPEAKHPFFLWNCLPRAGASQFHGHAQVMLSKVQTLYTGCLHSVAAAAQGQTYVMMSKVIIHWQ